VSSECSDCWRLEAGRASSSSYQFSRVWYVTVNSTDDSASTVRYVVCGGRYVVAMWHPWLRV